MLVNITAVISEIDMERLFPLKESNFLRQISSNLVCHRPADIPIACLTCWMVGNVCALSSPLRRVLVNLDAVDRIVSLQFADDFADVEFLSIQAWSLGMLMHGRNPPVPHSMAVKSLPREVYTLSHL